MSWEKKSEHVDMALKRHYVVLEESQTGAQHHVSIYLGHDSCPLCGHVKPKTETGEIDPHAIIRQEIAELEGSAAHTHAYARRHGVAKKIEKKQ
jgi:hypothetical protein